MKSDLVHVVAAVLYQDRRVFIFRRGPGTGAGAWEFPGGKVDPGETGEEALRREIQEELGLEITIEDCLGETIHQYPDKKIRLVFYWAPLPHMRFTLVDHDAYQCLSPHAMDPLILSEADREILSVIRADPRMKV